MGVLRCLNINVSEKWIKKVVKIVHVDLTQRKSFTQGILNDFDGLI